MSTDRWLDKNVVHIYKGILLSHKKEKGKTEEEMVGWHHWLNGYEFEQSQGRCERQGSLECCSPWGCKELDMTEWLNNKIKKECSYATCNNMDGLTDYATKQNKSEKDKYHMIYLYGQPKIRHSWTYLRNRKRLSDTEKRFAVASGEGE